MYTLTQAFIQSLTEFLPVSSSGHLLIVKHLFGLKNPGLVLDLTVHVGTTVCMGIYLWRRRAEFFKDKTAFLQLFKYALIATAATGIVGIFLADVVRSFYDLRWLAVNYLVMTILLISSRWMLRLGDEDRGLARMNVKFAIAIGLIQAIAVLPGISRSGLTIIGMMILGFDALFSFFFAFWVAIPTIIAAAGYEFLSEWGNGAVFEWDQLLIAFFTVICLSYPILILLRSAIQRRVFYLFGVYCFIVSSILFWVTR